MSQISPPIRILLACTLAFLATWMLFLRPKDDVATPVAATPTPAATARPVEAGGEKAQTLPGKLVEKANDAKVDTEAAQAAREEKLNGVDGAATPSSGATAATPSRPATPSAKAGKTAAATGGLPLRVLHAIAERKVVVLLFWSPRAAEDKAVRKALAGIDRHNGKVMAHAAHIKRIVAYGQITRGADVKQSPTVVVVDRNRQVRSLVGYVDRMTIDQAVTDALRGS
jgi:hypothetical protein